jgi:serine/threonine protein phosphatase PrpC
VFDLTSDDKYIVMATDGLWDNIARKETPAIVGESLAAEGKEREIEKVTLALLNNTLNKACL